MVIHMVRGLALLCIFIHFASYPARADEGVLTSAYKGISFILFDPPKPEIILAPKRPYETRDENITKQSDITSFSTNERNAGGCLFAAPYDSRPLMQRIGRAAKAMANNSAANIEGFSFQPHFSGLKGPKLILMRRDLERTFIKHQGSAAEIYHNAQLSDRGDIPCGPWFKHDWDLEIAHHVDVYDSDRAPLVRSDAIVTDRLHFGQSFIGTLGVRYNLHHNLEKEKDLFIIDRMDPLKQDVIAHPKQGFGMDRLMLSGFATPLPDTYIAGHIGYLSENIAGVGGEILYRSRGSGFAFGAEAWHGYKRYPYLKGVFEVEEEQRHTSALLNTWYDFQSAPITLGLSAGQFLDNDLGGQAKIRWAPAAGWVVEGYTTYTHESDHTLDNNNDTNFITGLRLTMPLGDFRLIPQNSRQTITIEPFSRDKGQRLDNPYPLYDLTDPWSTRNLYRYWDRITSN